MTRKAIVSDLNKKNSGLDPGEQIRICLETFGLDRMALASSLSIEDQVLTDLLLRTDANARIFFIDTGRHFQKTYDLMDETMRRYSFHYEVYLPDTGDLERMLGHYGPNAFYGDIELRKMCCEIRKVQPLKRVLKTLDAWVCGLRRDQSVTRQEIDTVEWDEANNLAKINPLANWSEDDVWNYIRKNDIPFNGLYQQGFRSIGCQPCTRAVLPDEDVRSGRWWWEDPNKKECGLHRMRQRNAQDSGSIF